MYDRRLRISRGRLSVIRRVNNRRQPFGQTIIVECPLICPLVATGRTNGNPIKVARTENYYSRTAGDFYLIRRPSSP